MDRTIEAGSKKGPVAVREPISLEDYRQKRNLVGSERFMVSIEKDITEEQRGKIPEITAEVQRFITDLNITDPLEEVVKYAGEIGDNKLSLWTLGFFSQAFVAGIPDPRQRDLMAGRLLDNLAARLLEKVPPQK